MDNSRPQALLQMHEARSAFARQVRAANPGLPTYEEGVRELMSRPQNTAALPLFDSSDTKPLVSWHDGNLAPGSSVAGTIKTFSRIDEQSPVLLVLAPPTVVDGAASPILGNNRVLATPWLGLYCSIQFGLQNAFATVEFDFGTGGQFNLSGGDVQVTVFNDTNLWYPGQGPGGQDGFDVALSLLLARGSTNRKAHRTLAFTFSDNQITPTNPLPPLAESQNIRRPPMTSRVTASIVTGEPGVAYRLKFYDGLSQRIADYLLSSDTPQEPIEMPDDVASVQIFNEDAAANIVRARAKFEVET